MAERTSFATLHGRVRLDIEQPTSGRPAGVLCSKSGHFSLSHLHFTIINSLKRSCHYKSSVHFKSELFRRHSSI